MQCNDRDTNLTIAMSHEFFRCQDALYNFIYLKENYMQNERYAKHNHQLYNAYSDFIFHYYEFLQGCYLRDYRVEKIKGDKKHKSYEKIENYIMDHMNRILYIRNKDIENGKQGFWNDFTIELPWKAPREFAEQFRKARNYSMGHVTYKRAQEIRLSDFYMKYNNFVYLMYLESQSWWGIQWANQEPYLKEMTDFAEIILKQKANTN